MVGGPLRLGPYLKVECMNQKTKLSIESHLIGDQNDIWVVGMWRFLWEEFGNKVKTLIALYYGKIYLFISRRMAIYIKWVYQLRISLSLAL